MEQSPGVMPEFLPGYCMLTRIENFFRRISLLLLHLFGSKFPKLIQLIPQDLILIKVASLYKWTVMQFAVNKEAREDKYEDDKAEDDFFEPLYLWWDIEPTAVMDLIVGLLFLVVGCVWFGGSHWADLYSAVI